MWRSEGAFNINVKTIQEEKHSHFTEKQKRLSEEAVGSGEVVLPLTLLPKK